MRRRLAVTISAIALILLTSTSMVAAVFAYRWANGEVSIALIRLFELHPPPYDTTCTGLRFAGFISDRYVDFSTGIPGDMHMVNGTRTPRGLIGVSGYWNVVSVRGFTGLRGFPITWQLREHKTYGAYDPDILFISQSPEGIRLDSYTRGARSLGNGYLFAILPVELVNNTFIRNRFNAYFSFREVRVVGVIDIANVRVYRFNDTYFEAYNSWAPPWQHYGQTYYRLYTIRIAGGPHSFDIENRTTLAATFGPYVTYSYVLMDYWTLQTVYIDVFYILLRTLDRSVLVNFTYPSGRYSIVMEKSGTTGDYGYLRFGVPGLTVSYFNMPLDTTSTIVTTRLVSMAGAGMGGIALVDSTLRNLYFIGVNNTNGALAVYRYIGASRALLGSAPIPGFANNTVYVLSVYHVREAGTNRITARLYSATGTLLATVTVSDGLVTPAYPGLAVQSWQMTFSDYIFLDYRIEHWIVRVQRVPLNYQVELYSGGTLVASGVSTTHLGPVDLVIPYRASVAGDSFVVRYPNGVACLNTTNITVYTRSIYDLTTGLLRYNLTARVFTADIGYGANTTIFVLLTVSVASGYTLYAYASLEPGVPASPNLDLRVYLVSSAGQRSDPIVVAQGDILSPRTSPSIPFTGSGNYVLVAARHTSPSTQSTIILDLFFCSTQAEAVCQVARITLVLRS